MLLAIDIGNTSTKFGVYENATLTARQTIPTIHTLTAGEIQNLAEIKQTVHAVVISSVVSELKDAYREYSNKSFGIEPIFIKSSSNFGLKISYVPAETLGVDRFVAAFAATEKYGKPCIVGDFGTATTIDAVNLNGEYLGGIITPGMNTMRESLFTKTSALPLIELRRPETVIGNSTAASIQSGIYFGYVALVDGLIERIKAELGEPAKVVATGGLAKFIAESSKQIETLDDDLMLDGLRLLHDKHLR